ncbi:MAG: phosphoethanolamine transferase [Sulfurimonas sp.]|nr:MAG: phosphoethanolamine transferase [Sulfurimonas sp.]
MKTLTPIRLILYVSIFLVLFDNVSFFTNVIKTYYPIGVENLAPLLSVGVMLTLFIALLFTLVSFRYTIKPILILILLVSSLANYFMNTYQVVIDDSMIQNIFETNLDESMELFDVKVLLYLLFLGVVPSYIVYKTPLAYGTWQRERLRQLKTVTILLLLMVLIFFSFSKFYTSFFREHKPLRFYTNPTYYIYSLGKYFGNTFHIQEALKPLGRDAVVMERDETRRKKLLIVVVGEAARADRLSLNGYVRQTNPLLMKEEGVVNFSNLYSCGTSTAVSVPCMFSIYTKADFSIKKGRSIENVLDVLQHTGAIDLLWRDNNFNSKGVANRIAYENYKRAENNPVCDSVECRDEGMLEGLEGYIDERPEKDVVIVLHQMGNHGPAYYKRYPQAFERFTPVCQTNQLEECSQEEISNAYDNAIMYTDYFLSRVIALLKRYDVERETTMIYMSDHGESLGENGLYLHGLPYFMAPETQTHIAGLMWFGTNSTDKEHVAARRDSALSHDYLFHTILGVMDVNTSVYDASLDMTRP